MAKRKKGLKLTLLFCALFLFSTMLNTSLKKDQTIKAFDNEAKLVLSSKVGSEKNSIQLDLEIPSTFTSEIKIPITDNSQLIDYSLNESNQNGFSITSTATELIIQPEIPTDEMINEESEQPLSSNLVTLNVSIQHSGTVEYVAETFQDGVKNTSNSETVTIVEESDELELEQDTTSEADEKTDTPSIEAVEEIKNIGKIQSRSAVTRGINDNMPQKRLIINEKFRNPIGTGANFIEPTILELSKTKSQTGSIWSKNKLDLTQDFSLKSYIYLGDSGKSAGDGVTFTLQNDERMATNPESVIGSSGFAMGAYSSKSGANYVHNALSIEFDTYYNNGSSNRVDRELNRNSDYGHIAMVRPKANNNNYTGEHSYVQYSPGYLSNGKWRSFTVSWNAETKTLNYQLEGFDQISAPIDPQTEFKGQEAYWGFTSSTGGNWAQNAIAISELPQELEADQEVLMKNVTQNGEYSSEINVNTGDIVEYQVTNKYLSEVFGASDWDNVATHATLPAGIDYEVNSAIIDGVAISDQEITTDGTAMIFPKATLSFDKLTQKLVFRGKVTGADGPKKLTTNFEAIGDNATIQDKQTIANLAEKKAGQVTFNYVDESNQPIAESVSKIGYLGESYSAERKEFPDYLLVEIPSNENGTFTEAPISVTYRYELRQLKFISAPSQISFGESLKISTKSEVYPISEMTGSLAVQDTRTVKSKWSITAKMSKFLESSSGHTLKNAIYYRHGSQNQLLGAEAISVYDGLSQNDDVLAISDEWTGEEGLSLQIKTGAAFPEAYSGEISWTLLDTPANE